MDYIRKIEILKKERKVSNEEISEALGISRGGLGKMLSNKDMKVSTLIGLANFFNVPVSFFFEDKIHNDSQVDRVFDVMKQIVKRNMM
jgi:transcriptional regulator with XRE-family HTH domain